MQMSLSIQEQLALSWKAPQGQPAQQRTQMVWSLVQACWEQCEGLRKQKAVSLMFHMWSAMCDGEEGSLQDCNQQSPSLD